MGLLTREILHIPLEIVWCYHQRAIRSNCGHPLHHVNRCSGSFHPSSGHNDLVLGNTLTGKAYDLDAFILGEHAVLAIGALDDEPAEGEFAPFGYV